MNNVTGLSGLGPMWKSFLFSGLFINTFEKELEYTLAAVVTVTQHFGCDCVIFVCCYATKLINPSRAADSFSHHHSQMVDCQ